MGLVTQKAMAERFAVTPQYINKLVLGGKIRKHGRQIDARQAAEVLKASGRKERKSPAKKLAKKLAKKPKSAKTKVPRAPKGPSDTKTQAFWKAQELEFKAKNAQLEYERSAGQWLSRPRVLELEQRKNATIKEKLRQLPRSLAQRLARLTNPAEVENLLREEIDLTLNQLAADPFGMAEAVAVQAPALVDPIPPAAAFLAMEAAP